MQLSEMSAPGTKRTFNTRLPLIKQPHHAFTLARPLLSEGYSSFPGVNDAFNPLPPAHAASGDALRPPLFAGILCPHGATGAASEEIKHAELTRVTLDTGD